MRKESSVIVLEFNELCPSLMDRFMAEGKLPNFERLYAEAEIYNTDAEEKPPNLNPWIQWVTVHSGLPFEEHGVFHLGEGHKLTKPCIWDVVSAANRRVLVCGSMNTRYDSPLKGVLVPDPWTAETAPYPEEIRPYFGFVQRNVHEHTNASFRFGTFEYVKFVSFMAKHGLSLDTTWSVAAQLTSELVGNHRWRRAVILDKLQMDLFSWYFRKLEPTFSTFFLNSTAHLQHKYWRNMEPEQFKIRPAEGEQKELAGAVLFGYQQMDQIVGRFLSLAGDTTTLILCTALSQQPCLTYDEEGGKCFYRPFSFEKLLEFSGVGARCDVSPVMSEQFHLFFEREQDAREAEQRLRCLQVGETPAMMVERKGHAVFAGCKIHHQLQRESQLILRGSDRKKPFFDLFYQGEGIKSGMHHPDGMLWIRRRERRHVVRKEKMSLCSIAPTILDILELPTPQYMRGRSLA